MDYRDFKPVGEGGTENAERKATGYWWSEPQYDAHGPLFALAKSMQDEQAARRMNNADYARLYGNRDLPTQISTASNRATASKPSDRSVGVRPPDRVTYNLVRVAIDTLCAKISKTKPKASFTTDGGNWSQQRRAKRLERFVFGVMHQIGVYPKGRDVFRDGCVWDLGGLKLYLDRDAKGKPNGICAERVDPNEIQVGAVDGMYGSPRTLMQTRPLAREVLRTLAPRWRKDLKGDELQTLLRSIEHAKKPDLPDAALAALGDTVEVREAWHLPSAVGADDGRHVICVSGATLLDEPYKRDTYPIEFFRFSKRLMGFEGEGVAEQLVGRQRTINRKLRAINDALRLMSVPRYFVRTGAQFSVEQLRNEPGIVMRGIEPPTVLTGNVVAPELWQSYKDDIREGLECVGVSQLSANAKKPAGLDAAVALREYQDIESERFVLVGQGWEEFFVGIAKQIIALATEAAEEGHPLEAIAEVRGGLERISWDKVAMDEKQYVLKAFPASSLPTTPAARKKAVRELWEDGLIDGIEYRRLLDMPDLDSANNATFAAQEDIEAEIERILDSGEDDETPEYRAPEPYQALEYGLQRFQSAYLRARRMGAPQERLQLLLDWMAQAEETLKTLAPSQPAPAPQAAPVQPTPGGPAPAGPPLAA